MFVISGKAACSQSARMDLIIMTAPIRQLLYISRAAEKMSDREMQQIVAVSKRNNWRGDITGCLLFSGEHFAQTLEGRPGTLDPLLARLNADPRHSDVKVLLDRSIEQRLYASWSMGYLFRMDLVDELEALLCGRPFTEDDAALLMQSAVADSVVGTL